MRGSFPQRERERERTFYWQKKQIPTVQCDRDTLTKTLLETIEFTFFLCNLLTSLALITVSPCPSHWAFNVDLITERNSNFYSLTLSFWTELVK